MKVALVTGASRGIGKACAIRLAKDGYAVVINYSHSEEQAQKVLDEIVAAGGTAITYKADVSDLNQVKQMVKDVSKELGGIDVLVNNAGIVRDEYLLMLNKDTLDRRCLCPRPATNRYRKGNGSQPERTEPTSAGILPDYQSKNTLRGV